MTASLPSVGDRVANSLGRFAYADHPHRIAMPGRIPFAKRPLARSLANLPDVPDVPVSPVLTGLRANRRTGTNWPNGQFG